MNFNDFLNQSYVGNTVSDYIGAFAAIALGIIALWIVKSIIIRRLKKSAQETKTKIDDTLVALLQKFIIPILYFGILYLSLYNLNLNEGIRKGLVVFGVTLITYFGIRMILELMKFSIFEIWVPKRKDRPHLEAQFRSLMPALSIIVWATGVIFLLDNLGFNISALMTGLGIGGVAVALAASAILSDLFAYVSIMLDKPFVLGDFLIVDNYLGTVEQIGIKTTRIRSLGGEQLVFSNKNLTDSRIRNYKRMQKRRVVFKLGVTYDTTLEKIKEIPAVIEKIIKGVPETAFDRAHFSTFGDFNLEIEAVYYVLSGDYNLYMDIQQQINFGIKGEFEKRNIEFAFPTQTLHLTQQQ